MPAILLRTTQKVAFGKWQEKLEQEKRYDAVEARLGGAALRRYRPLVGPDPSETFVKEYEYDSFATMEETFDRFGADPEWQALDAENLEKGITVEHRYEVFSLLPRE